jgi:hypothetical protein
MMVVNRQHQEKAKLQRSKNISVVCRGLVGRRRDEWVEQ